MTLPDLGGLLRALREGDVEFVVVGGVAVAAHEYVRATEDVDLVPAPDHANLDRLANVLVRLDAQLHRGRNLSVSTRHGDADIIQCLPGVPSHQALADEAIQVEIAGVEISVCSRDHLVAMKRARGKPIDIADLERLTDTQR